MLDLLKNKNVKYALILFIAVLYFNPTLLARLTSSSLGKTILVIFIGVIGYLFGKKATLIASGLSILLLMNSDETVEGMDVLETPVTDLETKITEIKKSLEQTKDIVDNVKDTEAALNGGEVTGNDQITTSNELRNGQSSKDIVEQNGMNTASPDLASGQTEENVKPVATTVTEGFATIQ